MHALKRCTEPRHSVASDDPIGSSNTNMLTKMISKLKYIFTKST